jgi:hypothetical protein
MVLSKKKLLTLVAVIFVANLSMNLSTSDKGAGYPPPDFKVSFR